MAESSGLAKSSIINSEIATSDAPKSYSYYHAGPLFTVSDLHTNTLLSRAIRLRSNSKYIPTLPQDVELRDTSHHSIRDEDIRALLSSDLALFVYDGTELDSGTVVEFMFAKMADIPAVIVRTDFRGGGDQDQGSTGLKGDPWNLMSSFYPRTKSVVLNSMLAYKQGVASAITNEANNTDAGLAGGEHMFQETAAAIVAAFDEVSKEPAVLPAALRESVYHWLAIMPNLKDGEAKNVSDMLKLCSEKVAKGIL